MTIICSERHFRTFSPKWWGTVPPRHYPTRQELNKEAQTGDIAAEFMVRCEGRRTWVCNEKHRTCSGRTDFHSWKLPSEGSLLGVIGVDKQEGSLTETNETSKLSGQTELVPLMKTALWEEQTSWEVFLRSVVFFIVWVGKECRLPMSAIRFLVSGDLVIKESIDYLLKPSYWSR